MHHLFIVPFCVLVMSIIQQCSHLYHHSYSMPRSPKFFLVKRLHYTVIHYNILSIEMWNDGNPSDVGIYISLVRIYQITIMELYKQYTKSLIYYHTPYIHYITFTYPTVIVMLVIANCQDLLKMYVYMLLTLHNVFKCCCVHN